MSYPRLYRAVKDMVGEASSEVPTARAIVRRAGLRSVPSEDGSLEHSRQPICAFLEPAQGFYAYQWLVNLEAFSQIRIDCREPTLLYLLCSETLSGPLDPSDWQPVTGVDIGASDPPEPVTQSGAHFLNWYTLDEEFKTTLRIGVSTDPDEPALDEISFVEARFGFALQGR